MRQSTASGSALLNCFSVFEAIASVDEGRQVMEELGARSFFWELKKNTAVQAHQESIDEILKVLVNGGNMPPSTLAESIPQQTS